jgi:hypothetical protein
MVHAWDAPRCGCSMFAFMHGVGDVCIAVVSVVHACFVYRYGPYIAANIGREVRRPFRPCGGIVASVVCCIRVACCIRGALWSSRLFLFELLTLTARTAAIVCRPCRPHTCGECTCIQSRLLGSTPRRQRPASAIRRSHAPYPNGPARRHPQEK